MLAVPSQMLLPDKANDRDLQAEITTIVTSLPTKTIETKEV